MSSKALLALCGEPNATTAKVANKVATKDGLQRVPISHLSINGEVLGSEFESTLERDLIMTCAFDGSVNWFQDQPLTIDYRDAAGMCRRYTPDLVIHFGTDQKTTRPPMLCEVKLPSSEQVHHN